MKILPTSWACETCARMVGATLKTDRARFTKCAGCGVMARCQVVEDTSESRAAAEGADHG